MREAGEELRKALGSVVAMTVPAEKQTLALTMVSAILDNYTVTVDETDGEDRNAEILEEYIRSCSLAGRSDGTVRMYRYAVKGFMDHLQKDVRRATSKDINSYLGAVKARGVSNSYVDTRRAWLSSFFSWMENTDEIVKSPMRAVAPIKVRKEVRKPFSSVEVDRMREACRNARQRSVLEILLSSGLRVNELVNVRQDDIDWTTLSIHVREGKGGKERLVYMSEVAAAHLREHLKDEPTDWIISYRGAQLHTDGVRKLLHAIGDTAGVDDVHPHRFRRTFATGMVDRGMPVNELQPLMGHAKLDTTMTYVYQSGKKIESSYRRYAV